MWSAGFASIVIADLGVTHQTDVEAMRAACLTRLTAAARVPQFIDEVTKCYINCYLNIFNFPVAPAHDVLTVMYLLRPDIFVKKAARVEVELQGQLTRGMSVADWGGKWGRPNNCEVLMSVDNEAFIDEFVKVIGTFS